MAPARNLELKARDPDPVASLDAALRLGASDQGWLWQRDTYFSTVQGRLKLREQQPGDAHLIHYFRADLAQQRQSTYRIVPLPDADLLREVLAHALEVQAVVVKQRRLLLWHDVRIHLDVIEQLGTFIELEAVLAEHEQPADAQARIACLRAVMEITDHRLESTGYADQLIARRPKQSTHSPA